MKDYDPHWRHTNLKADLFFFGQKIRAFLHRIEMKYIYQVELNLFHSKKSSPPSQAVSIYIWVSPFKILKHKRELIPLQFTYAA